MTRVCLDSNVLVAAFAARGLCADLLALVIAEHELVVPEVVAQEVRRVLTTELKVGPPAFAILEAVFERCEVVSDVGAASLLKIRDPSDERILAEAVGAGVEILVTGDDDLLTVAEQSPIRILSPRAFMTLARGSTL